MLGAQGSVLGVQCSALSARGSGLSAQGSGLNARDLGLSAQDSGLRAQGSGLRAGLRSSVPLYTQWTEQAESPLSPAGDVHGGGRQVLPGGTGLGLGPPARPGVSSASAVGFFTSSATWETGGDLLLNSRTWYSAFYTMCWYVLPILTHV